jgi:hypothetical protein
MRSACWRESFASCTSSTRRGGDHLGAVLSAVTSSTSSLTASRGRNLTPPTSTTTSSKTTIARPMTGRSTASGKKEKKKFQKMMSRACAALSDLDFSNDDSSYSEEDEKVKRKPDDFTGLCLMGKSLEHISNSDSDVSDDVSSDGLSLRVVELENTLCNEDKLLCKVFRKNKKLNLELESVFLKLLLFDLCTMI